MQELITKDYNGFAIEFELIDGQLMANATSMCAAFGCQPKDWLKTASAKRFIEAKRTKILLAENQMVVARNGGLNSGTWIHECLVRKLAEWLDIDFEAQCDEWLTELLRTGSVALAQPVDQDEVILMLAQRNADHSRHLRVLDAQQKALAAQQQADHQQLNVLTKQVAVVAAKQTTSENGYFTVAGYASLLGRKVDLTGAQALGSQAKALSAKLGLSVDHIRDPRFGKVNTYHEDVLVLVFGAQAPRLVA